MEWRHGGERHRLTWSNEQAALDWKNLIEVANGDREKADAALLARSSNAPMLEAVAAEYIERLIDVSDFTIGSYKRHVANHLPRLNMPVDRITEDDVARWVSWMHKDAPNGKGEDGDVKHGYSPKTIKNAHGFLHSVLIYAVKRGYRTGDPASETRLPSMQARDERDKFITHEEFRVLLGHVPDRYKPHAVFLWGSGVRASEMLALMPEDFTVQDGAANVRINKALKMNERGTGVTIGGPKTARSRRTIPVNDEVMAYVWPLVRAAGHGNWVFPLMKPRTSSTLWKAMWKPTMDSAKAAGFTKSPGVHSLRHSHASHLLSEGVPMHEVSRQLGHSHLSITDAVYAHIVPSRTRSTADAMMGSIPPPSQPHQLPQ